MIVLCQSCLRHGVGECTYAVQSYPVLANRSTRSCVWLQTDDKEYLANNGNILDTSSYDLLQALYDVKVDCNLSFAYLDKTIQQHLLEYNDFCKNRTIEEKANKITLSKILSSGGKIMSTIKIPHQIIKLFQNSKDHIL